MSTEKSRTREDEAVQVPVSPMRIVSQFSLVDHGHVHEDAQRINWVSTTCYFICHWVCSTKS